MAADTRGTVFAVLASALFMGVGGGIVFPVIPNLGALVGITPWLVGVVLSANRMVRLLANPPAGALTDRIGTRTPFLVGLGLETASTFGYLIAIESSAPAAWFFVARVCWGLGGALLFASAFTIAADVSDDETRGRTMSLIRAGASLGVPVGMAIGGLLSEVYSVPTAFWTASAASVLGTAIAVALVPETHARSTDERSAVSLREIDTGLPALTVGAVNFALLFTYSGVVFATLVTYLDVADLATAAFGPMGMSGLLIGLSVLSGSAAMVASGRVTDHLEHRVPMLVGALAVLSTGLLVLAWAETLRQVFAATFLIGVGQGGVNGPLLALLGDLTPTDRMGRAAGTNNALGDLGAAVGLLVALPAAHRFGFANVYGVAAALPLLAGLGLAVGVYAMTGSISPSVDESVSG